MRYHQCAAPPPEDNATEFVMSDETVDRVGDSIMQSGWDLKNFRRHPVALFNHDRDQVIGKWADVAVRDGRLTGRLELAQEGTSALVDTIRKLIDQKILRAVSVGFRALKKEKLTEAADDFFGPFRFLKSELLECSLVSIPANPNALSNAKALHIPRDHLAQIFREFAGEDRPGPWVHTGKLPKPPALRKAAEMNLSTKIQNAQADLVRMRDQLAALAAKDDLDEAEETLFDELPGEIDAVAKQLERLEGAERRIMAPKPSGGHQANGGGELRAEPIDDRARIVFPKRKIEPADLWFRSGVVALRSFVEQIPLETAQRTMYGTNIDENLSVVLRAAVNPAMTTVAGWAAELVQQANGGFLDLLFKESIYGPLAAMGARYDLGSNGSMKIPTRASTPRAAGAWVGEGAPKPVKRIGLSSITLTPNKLAVITVFTEEMAMYSTPAIEGLLRESMVNDTSEALDGYLIDNVAASATRPAGLLNGVTPITASAATPATAAMVADLKALVAAIVANGGGRSIAILMNPAQALSLGFAQTTTGDFLFESTDEAGRKFSARIIVSRSVAAGTVIALDAADFATVTGDQPRFAVSRDATLHMEDTTPLAIGTAGTPTVVAAPAHSLFQTDTVGLRLSLYLTWAMRRAGMVATITGITAW